MYRVFCFKCRLASRAPVLRRGALRPLLGATKAVDELQEVFVSVKNELNERKAMNPEPVDTMQIGSKFLEQACQDSMQGKLRSRRFLRTQISSIFITALQY